MIQCTNYATCRSEYHGSAADAERLLGWRIRQEEILCRSCAAGILCDFPGSIASAGGTLVIHDADSLQLRNRIGELEAERDRLTRRIEALVIDNERLQVKLDGKE